jgi:hypothetical protein
MNSKYTQAKQDADGELAGLMFLVGIVIVSLVIGIIIGLNV